MTIPLLGVTFLMALGNWFSVLRNKLRYEYLTKPGTLLFLILWFVSTTGFSRPSLWFMVGLVFSLFGDIFLMLPRNLFIPGLGSFLLAQICYIVGFNQTPFPATAAILVPVVVVAFFFAWIFRLIKTSLDQKPDGKQLIPAVFVYSFALSLMLFSALSTLFRPEWSLLPAVMASLGGVLFFSSDSILAYNRFVRSIPNGHLFTMITYHLGQLGLMAGVVLHLSLDL